MASNNVIACDNMKVLGCDFTATGDQIGYRQNKARIPWYLQQVGNAIGDALLLTRFCNTVVAEDQFPITERMFREMMEFGKSLPDLPNDEDDDL